MLFSHSFFMGSPKEQHKMGGVLLQVTTYLHACIGDGWMIEMKMGMYRIGDF